MRYLVPLGIFVLLVALLAVGLTLNPREVPSPLINRPAPAFQLPQLHKPDLEFSQKDMQGQVWLLNVWASWCVACREEHATLLDLSRQRLVPIVGLNYKDTRPEGLGWLNQFGNPYDVSAFDQNGRVGIDFGVYGVPETFLIDQRGIIRMKHIGPLTPQVIKTRIEPMVKALLNG